MAEQISLLNALRGLGGLHRPEGTTLFQVTLRAHVPSVPKAEWVRRQVPGWVELLNTQSGATVASWEFTSPRGNPDKYGNYLGATPPEPAPEGSIWNSGVIGLEMEVPGGLDLSGVHEEVGKAISGSVRKVLALWVLERFPPPFDPLHPLVAAGSLDYLQIFGSGHLGMQRFEDTVVREIVPEACSAAGIDLIELEYAPAIRWHTTTLRWKVDVSDDVRKGFLTEVQRLLRERVGYQFQGLIRVL